MPFSFDEPNSVTLADGPQLDSYGRLRIADQTPVLSYYFSNSPLDFLFNTTTSGTASAAFNAPQSSVRLSTGTASGDSVIRQTKRYIRYNPGWSYFVSLSGVFGPGKANVRQRWGYFDTADGLFFQQTSSALSVVVRTSTSGSPVDTAIPQSSWNLDKLDGTGLSGITLDTSKHNLYVIDFVWQGAGRIRFGLILGNNVVYCHEIQNSNILTAPFLRSPSRPIRVELTNTGIAASSTNLEFTCCQATRESGSDAIPPLTFSASRGIVDKSVAAIAVPLISIRPKTSFSGITNRVMVVPSDVQVLANQQDTLVRLVLNPTLTGASFASVGTNSATEFDIAATAYTGGTVISEFYVSAQSTLLGSTGSTLSSSLDQVVLGLDIAGSTADILTVVVQSLAGGTDTVAAITFQEYQ